jgi:tripartite-type tricarboxylate transporter receptor subunit TctC
MTTLSRWFILSLALCGAAVAQTAYPSKPVTLIVPFPPGGALDIVARSLAQEMTPLLGQTVIVDNRPGAGGGTGSGAAAKAVADGHTLLFGSIATHALAPALYAKLPYDALKDFVPITQVTSGPLVLVSSAVLPATTLPALIAQARAQPGKLNYASTGNGTAVHLAGELFKSAAAIDVAHIPYKGGAEANTALITGEASYMIVNVQLALPHIKSGKVRALAVTGPRRLAILPEVPTMAESGLPSVEVSTWFGLFAPANTPADVVARLQRDSQKALQPMRERLLAQGDEPVGSTADAFALFVRAEHAKWGKVVRDAGVKIE